MEFIWKEKHTFHFAKIKQYHSYFLILLEQNLFNHIAQNMVFWLTKPFLFILTHSIKKC